MKYIVVTCLTLVMCSLSSAQAQDRSTLAAQRPEVHFDAQLLRTSTASELRVVVFYTLCPDILTFNHTPTSVRGQDQYTAAYACTIECMDSLGVIRYSKQVLDTIRVSSFEATNSRQHIVQRRYSFTMPTQLYTVSMDVEQSAAPLGRFKSRLLRAEQDPRSMSPGSCIIAQPQSDTTVAVSVCNGGIDFSSQNRQMYVVIPEGLATGPWLYKCARTATRDEFYTASVAEQSGRCTISHRTTFTSGEPELLYDNLSLKTVKDDGVRTAVLTCALETVQLTPGSYVVKVYQEKSKDTLRFDLESRWTTAPVCLKSMVALQVAMSYIMTDAEYEDLTDGSDRELRRKLMNWWKKKDPTPRTPYNEAMQAYFRRADESRLLYMTPVEPDGLKTERGRVYMLFGTPSDVESKAESGQFVQEIWTYTNKVKKRITFEADPRGVYRIIREENM